MWPWHARAGNALVLWWLRRRLGLPYWSFSAWAKLKVKNAVNFIGDFEDVAMRGKVRILTGSLAPDVRGLAALLLPIAKRDPRVRTLGAARLARALTEWLACFPVYRTYIDDRTPAPSDADRDVIERVARRCS